MHRPAVTSTLVALLLSSCATGLTVVKSGHPNPFAGQRKFQLAAIDFEHASVNGAPESEFLAQLNAEETSIWNRNKAEFQTALVLAFRESTSNGPLQLESEGSYSLHPFVLGLETLSDEKEEQLALQQARLVLEIRDADGVVIDKVEAAPRLPTGLRLGSDERMRIVASKAGNWFGDYLVTRTEK